MDVVVVRRSRGGVEGVKAHAMARGFEELDDLAKVLLASVRPGAQDRQGRLESVEGVDGVLGLLLAGGPFGKPWSWEQNPYSVGPFFSHA